MQDVITKDIEEAADRIRADTKRKIDVNEKMLKEDLQQSLSQQQQ